jgi:hypothetical protein
MSNSKPTPKKQSDFYICQVDWIHVGMIAVFGVNSQNYPGLEDIDDRVLAMCRKLSTLSYAPGPLVVSRMGEEVPEPDFGSKYPETQPYTSLTFSFIEREWWDKLFLIMFLRGDHGDGSTAMAYINVQCGHLETLLRLVNGETLINLADYATIVLTRVGDLTDEDRLKLQRNYLFGERHTNVRLFPKLPEVT